jgi:predicted DCC family thiol-disulfide oxidoreductase YuxK
MQSMPKQVAAGIVIFDGDCTVCNAFREATQSRSPAETFEFIAYQSADLENLSPGLTLEMAEKVMHVIRPDGKRLGGARAFFEVMRYMHGFWGFIGKVWAFPPLSLLAEPFYRLGSKNRPLIARMLGL